MSQATKAVANFNPELAVQFYKKALDMAPQDTTIIDTLADVYLQLGLTNDALNLFQQSVSIQPRLNPIKWLYLAQLQYGSDAVSSYKTGIEYLSKTQRTEITKQQISKAYCSMAEIYLTDLCYDNDAETLCEQYVKKSLEIDGSCLDAMQTMVSLRISQNRGKEAIDLIKTVYDMIMQKREQLRNRTVMEDLSHSQTKSTDQSTADDAIMNMPETDFCIATTKLLIECAVHNSELAECAIELGIDLLNFDDDNIELWYLVGVAALATNPPDTEASRYHLDQALVMVNTLIENNKQNDRDDENSQLIEYLNLIKDHIQIAENLEGGSVNANDVILEDVLEEEEAWSDDDSMEAEN